MPTTTEDRRAVRTCEACKKKDDHPHHVQHVAAVHPITEEELDLSVSRHIDCCAALGCEVCATTVEHAGGRKGLELAEYMQAISKAHARALFERHGIETPGFEYDADNPPAAEDVPA